MVRVLARSIVGVALLALGAAGGAAFAARPDQAVPAAVSAPAPPVEVRTIVKRRTVHVYRKPHHPRPAVVSAPRTAAPATAPAPVVPAPAVRVVRPVAPAAPAHPLVTRTSGSAGGGGGEREHEGEHDD